MIKPFSILYKSILFALLCALLASCQTATNGAKTPLREGQWYPVTGYVDGDTFKVEVNNERVTVRMLYIDTPETKKANTPVQPFGPEASDYTEKLLAESGEVKLTFDKEMHDKYDRTLAIVELKDGRILNELLLKEGLAQVLIVEPNVKMENVYKQLEQQAKQAGVGLWQNAANQSLSEVPVKEASPTGISIRVDKFAEVVTITNNSDTSYRLDDWKLVSVKGNQTYKFNAVTLPANSHIKVISSNYEPSKPEPGTLHWGESNIWNNNESDPAELYNASNELVAAWEDE